MSTRGRQKPAAGDPEGDAESLHSAAIHLLRKLRRSDSASGLNAPRLSALSVVVFSGPLTLGRLAEAEQVRPPTMTRIVHALHREGLVLKTADPGDRRTVLIAATMKGKRVLLEGRNRRIRGLAAAMAALGPADRTALRRALPVLRKLSS